MQLLASAFTRELYSTSLLFQHESHLLFVCVFVFLRNQKRRHTHLIDVCRKLLYTSTLCQVAGADVGFARRPWRMCRGARNWTTQLTGCFKTLSHWNPVLVWESTNSPTVTNRILTFLIEESLQTFYLALLLGGFWHPNFCSCRTWSFDHRCSNRLGQEEQI